MKITIVNRNAERIHEALGLSEERVEELSSAMDLFIANAKKNDNDVTVADCIQAFCSFCNTNEEMAYCCYVHGMWASQSARYMRQSIVKEK